MHGGQSLTDSEHCSSFPFIHSKSYAPVVTGIPTDVNWAVWKRPVVVWPSSCEFDICERSYTPARELSDDISALLYNLDNTMTL
jgi:hypothetical protein